MVESKAESELPAVPPMANVSLAAMLLGNVSRKFVYNALKNGILTQHWSGSGFTRPAVSIRELERVLGRRITPEQYAHAVLALAEKRRAYRENLCRGVGAAPTLDRSDGRQSQPSAA